jgi:hypothetical protein
MCHSKAVESKESAGAPGDIYSELGRCLYEIMESLDADEYVCWDVLGCDERELRW